jgi:hypothetical protein
MDSSRTLHTCVRADTKADVAEPWFPRFTTCSPPPAPLLPLALHLWIGRAGTPGTYVFWIDELVVDFASVVNKVAESAVSEYRTS